MIKLQPFLYNQINCQATHYTDNILKEIRHATGKTRLGNVISMNVKQILWHIIRQDVRLYISCLFKMFNYFQK